MMLWRSDFLERYGDCRANVFWLHVGQVCGSLYVMKLIAKAVSAGKEALTTVICEIVDVEFARKHMELVEAN